VPATIPVRIRGVARDEAGKPVEGAAIILYPITETGSNPAGRATTNAEGRYDLREVTLPVRTSFGSHPLPPEITPYASFIVSGTAPGLGIAWSPQQSVYALNPPNPNDIQGRLPLGRPVVLELTFPKAAFLEGRVVDEDGRPVAGAKLQVLDADLLDDAGRETNNRQGYDWKAVPGSVGRAVTGLAGGFRIEGIANRACCSILVVRPENDNTSLGFYAATISGPDIVHEQLPPDAFNGRLRHRVRTNPMTIVFPILRQIDITVVGEDTGRPIAGARVSTVYYSLAPGVAAFGTTDAAGHVRLGLPPGRYRGIVSDPPTVESRYIRTHQRPLVLERGQGAHPLEIRQQVGFELIIQAVGVRPASPLAGAYFWMTPEDHPDEKLYIEPSTFGPIEKWTDAAGELRSVLAPEPGRRYRVRFGGIHKPNTAVQIKSETDESGGYEVFPTQSAPIELTPGGSARLRFVLRKADSGKPEAGNGR
jgi:hypothetical protein